jgi:hypothetical protein
MRGTKCELFSVQCVGPTLSPPDGMTGLKAGMSSGRAGRP